MCGRMIIILTADGIVEQIINIAIHDQGTRSTVGYILLIIIIIRMRGRCFGIFRSRGHLIAYCDTCCESVENCDRREVSRGYRNREAETIYVKMSYISLHYNNMGNTRRVL